VSDNAGEQAEVGVGPHPTPWPDDARYDCELLEHGDRRNVADRYRYWTVEAIVEDLDRDAFPVEVAIENWEHDFNIGTVVRNANAFGVRRVHIVGRRRWNRRGAMVTDRYLHVEHHPDVAALVADAAARDLAVVGIDNVEGSVPIESVELPRRSLLVFGQEGPGLSPAARAAAEVAPSTPASPRASRCTPGCASTPTAEPTTYPPGVCSSHARLRK
jgi:tRNA G18 (ribose-2'-O)-methylase SpoU